MANSAFDHSPTIVVPGSSTNTGVVTWSGTGANTFLDSTVLVVGDNITIPGTITFGGTQITSTAAELNLLDGVSGLVQGDFTKLAAVEATAAELNLLNGVSGLVQADLTKLAAIDSTAAEVNLLDAITRGSIIYGNASGATALLGKGTNGQVLTSNATDVLWADAAGGGGVDTTGTPASNHISIFHDSDTLKSTANFTFDNWPLVKRAGGTGETMGLNGFNSAKYPTRLVIRKSQTNTIDTYTQVDSDQTVGGILFEGATNNNSWKPCAELRVDTDGDAFTDSTSPGMMRIFTTPSGGVEPLARFVVRQDGKIGMGANNPNGQLSIGSGNAVGSITAPAIQIGQDNSNTFRLGLYTTAEGGHLHNNNGNNGIILESRDVEVARFWASGSNRHVGFGGITTPNDTMFKIEYSSQSWVFNFANAHGSGSNHVGQMNFQGFSPDSHNNIYLYGADTTASRFLIYSDGDMVNHDNSYGSTSDERIKEGIRDANSQWDDVKAIKVRNFKKKEDVAQYGENAWEQIGVIAQEVELVSPKLIREGAPSKFEMEQLGMGHEVENGENETKWVPNVDEDGNEVTVKSIGYSVLHMKAFKALQEAMARIEILEAEVDALKG